MTATYPREITEGQVRQGITGDLTPNAIAANLIALGKELIALVNEFEAVEVEAANARREAEVAYARAFMGAEGAMDMRKQMAIATTSDLRYLADLSERKVASCKEAIKALHLRVEIGRTLSATVRDEMKLAGSGVHP